MGVKTRCKVIKNSANQIVKSATRKGVTPHPNPKMPKKPTPPHNSTAPTNSTQTNAMNLTEKLTPLYTIEMSSDDEERSVSSSEFRKLMQDKI